MNEQANNLDIKIVLDRRARVLDLLETQGQVKVAELSKMFKVSEVTIRNDLTQLEKKGLLIRARGGAIRSQGVGVDYALNVKAKKFFKEKRAIGLKAAELVNEGDTIILDSGSTTMEIARNLGHFRELTVITNALNIARQLAEFPNIKIIMPGGILRKKALAMVGPSAETAIRNYFCDKLFLGVDGIDPHYGISTPNVEEAHLNRIMIEISREVIVVTDSSKFGKRSLALITPMNKVHTVITDSGISRDDITSLTNAGVHVIVETP